MSAIRMSWLEGVLAICAILALAAAVFSPNWIEGLMGFAPDDGDGTFERGVAFALSLPFVASWAAARFHWAARLRAARASH